MRCEVCGREILGPPQRRIIEGAKLTVCHKCASFGTADWIPGRPTFSLPPNKPQSLTRETPRPRIRNDVESVEQLELAEDYGVLIRKARQRLGLSEKDLAMKMQEKESVIKKLEKQEFTPDNKLIQKIKRYLGLDLVEHTETGKAQILAKPTGAKTIGDMLRMDSKESEEKP
jgi:putative transcription factor